MWIEPLYDSSSLLGIIPILLCIWFAKLPGTMIPSSHHPMNLWLNINKQHTWNHLPYHHCFDPHDIPILDGYLKNMKKTSSSEIHQAGQKIWPRDCRWQAYFINAKGWKVIHQHPQGQKNGQQLLEEINSFTLVDGMMWIPYGRRSWDFLPKHQNIPDMLVHHSVTLRHVGQNFSTPKRSTNFDGNTPSAIGIGRVCVVTFRFETAVIQTCWAVSIWYICLGGSTRPQHQPTSGIHLFRLVGELQWISTHRNRGLRPQNHTLAPSPRAVAPWRAFFFSKSRHWKFPWRPTKKKPSRSWRRNAKRFFCIQTWRSNGLKNTVTWGYGEYHRIYHLYYGILFSDKPTNIIPTMFMSTQHIPVSHNILRLASILVPWVVWGSRGSMLISGYGNSTCLWSSLFWHVLTQHESKNWIDLEL